MQLWPKCSGEQAGWIDYQSVKPDLMEEGHGVVKGTAMLATHHKVFEQFSRRLNVIRL